MNEIPAMLIGPFPSWQSRLERKNQTTFDELLDIPEQLVAFTNHEKVITILAGLPFDTEFIGFIRDDIDHLVCIEGHHRATAIAIAKREGRKIDFSSCHMTIAITHLSKEECPLIDEMAKKGTERLIP
jgi:hypothetical protein